MPVAPTLGIQSQCFQQCLPIPLWGWQPPASQDSKPSGSSLGGQTVLLLLELKVGFGMNKILCLEVPNYV